MKIQNFFLNILMGLISIWASAQTDYYVATTGNNTNNGSIATPWETIQHAVNQLNPGDTLHIMAGTYAEKIDIDVSGSSGNYITIRNYQNDEVVMDAVNFNDDNAIIWTDNAYLRIQGLHLTNNIHNFASGMALQDVAHHIEIVNNKISNIKFSNNPNASVNSNTNAVPLSIYADNPNIAMHDILIQGNEVFNNRTGFSENIAAGGNFTDFIIENNIVHDNTNIGIDIGGNYGTSSNPANDHGRNGIIRNNLVYNCISPYSPAAGIYIDGGWDIIVENNICHHNGYGGEIGCEENGTTQNITFRNNLFYENAYTGMHFGAYDSNTSGNVINSFVYNNTFYKNDTENNSNGEMIFTKSENCKVENNIFYVSSQNVLTAMERTQNGLSLDYNLVFSENGASAIEADVNGTSYEGLSNFYSGIGQGENSVFGNPLFVDATNSDFHIQSSSSAIDAGNPAFIVGNDEIDMDGEDRVYSTRVDCGADEYNATLEVNNYNQTAISMYPNPTNGVIYIEGISEYNYKIYTVNGQLITSAIGDNQNRIDLTSQSKGLYIVKIFDKNGITITKVIKE